MDPHDTSTGHAHAGEDALARLLVQLRRGASLNIIGDWQNQLEHLLRREWAARQRERAHELAADA